MLLKYSLYCLSALSFFLSSCASHNSHHNEIDDDDEHLHDLSDIIFEPEQAERFGIEFERVESSDFLEVIKTSGMIESAGGDLYTVTAKKSGIVRLAEGISTGSMIKAGNRIATISSDGVEGGDVSKAANANLAAAKSEYERLIPLYEEKLVTASVFREAERAYEEAKAIASNRSSSSGVYVETSPIEGSVSSLFVNSGQYVEVGDPIAIVSKNQSLSLKADLPARFASKISEIESANFIPEGSDAIFSLKDLNGKKISGDSYSSSQGGYLPVYFTFSGNPLLHTGGYAEIFLLGKNKSGVISVPRSALIELQGNKYAYVVKNGHSYEKRLVVTGTDNGQRIEIKDGLQPGDSVVAKGASILRMVEVSAVAPPSHTHNH